MEANQLSDPRVSGKLEWQSHMSEQAKNQKEKKESVSMSAITIGARVNLSVRRLESEEYKSWDMSVGGFGHHVSTDDPLFVVLFVRCA